MPMIIKTTINSSRVNPLALRDVYILPLACSEFPIFLCPLPAIGRLRPQQLAGLQHLSDCSVGKVGWRWVDHPNQSYALPPIHRVGGLRSELSGPVAWAQSDGMASRRNIRADRHAGGG